MVLQGGAGVTPQVVESMPVEGLTVTAAEADTRQQPRIDAHTSKAARSKRVVLVSFTKRA